MQFKTFSNRIQPNNLGFMKTTFIILITAFIILGCKKETESEVDPPLDYRLKYTGKYTCIKKCREWHDYLPEKNSTTGPYEINVSLDSESKNCLIINTSKAELDTTQSRQCSPNLDCSDNYWEFQGDTILIHSGFYSSGGGKWCSTTAIKTQ